MRFALNLSAHNHLLSEQHAVKNTSQASQGSFFLWHICNFSQNRQDQTLQVHDKDWQKHSSLRQFQR